jgi:hypothetical protein
MPKVTPKGKATASFTIRWLQKAASAHRPHYISPSAQSVIVEVNPVASSPGPVTFANNTGSPTTTVTFDAPAGTDDIVFTVYDAAQQTGETQAQGNLLGQVELPAQTITVGQQNNIAATIGGITSRIDLAPAAHQPFVETDPNGGYDIVGDTAQTFVATPYDADGNVIVGPGSPALSFSSTSAGTSLDVEPASRTPNAFTVRALAGQPTTSPLGVVVRATDSGAPHFCTANMTLRVRSALYVSYTSGSGSKILVYDDQGNQIALPSAFAGITSPGGVAYASKEHRLYVADSGANKILAFDASGNAVAGFAAPSLTGVKNLAYDPASDRLYATTPSSVKAFNPDGTAIALGGTAFANTASPDAITFVGVDGFGNTDDEIAVGNDSNSGNVSIDYYAPDGTFLRNLVYDPTTNVVAPISALAWIEGTYDQQLVMLGGPQSATFGQDVTYDGSVLGSQNIWTTSRVGGATMVSTVPRSSAALGPSNYELFITQSDTNTIAGFIYSQGTETGFNYPDVTFVTPVPTGMTNPVGITSAL